MAVLYYNLNGLDNDLDSNLNNLDNSLDRDLDNIDLDNIII